MYVRTGPRAANSTDSHVQARTAPQNRRQQRNSHWITGTGNGTGTAQAENSRVHGMLRHTTGMAHLIHPLWALMHLPYASH